VECEGCEKWFHTDCAESSDSIEFLCTMCKAETRKKVIGGEQKRGGAEQQKKKRKKSH
jgi:hypothetical protein